jgi:hypothetical protein
MMTAHLNSRECGALHGRLAAQFAEVTPAALGYAAARQLPPEGAVIALVDSATGTDDRPWVKVDVYVYSVPRSVREGEDVDDVLAAAAIRWKARAIAERVAPLDIDYLVEVHLLA